MSATGPASVFGSRPTLIITSTWGVTDPSHCSIAVRTVSGRPRSIKAFFRVCARFSSACSKSHFLPLRSPVEHYTTSKGSRAPALGGNLRRRRSRLRDGAGRAGRGPRPRAVTSQHDLFCDIIILHFGNHGTGWGAGQPMKAEVLNAFFQAAVEILRCEIKDSVHRGALAATIAPTLDSEVTVFLGAVGNLRGLVLFGMSRETALALASRMAGMPFTTLDDLVLSAVAELGNVVTGRALMALSEQGYACDLTPPSVMVGKGAYFSTLGIPRIRIPLYTSLGEIRLDVALQESPKG
nr:MAG: hypothetical protein DIU70_08825 [Bacillota bacterium]